MKHLAVLVFFALLPGLLLLQSCGNNETPEPQPEPAQLKLRFSHNVRMDTMMYVNAAGNPYSVSEIQYFVSDVRLHKTDGSTVLLGAWEDIHYVDTDIASTFEYALGDTIAAGEYSGISFTFGISGEKNKSYMFVNPPESFMFWPEYLGGGYHYMKLNGKWLDTDGKPKVYNFHLGIGQIYDSITGDITGFVQNFFDIDLSNTGFTVADGNTVVVDLMMDVPRWFTSPHDFDFNEWGGDIMQNQDAMHIGCENGADVFLVQGIAVTN